MDVGLLITERQENGQTISCEHAGVEMYVEEDSSLDARPLQGRLAEFAAKVFLPAGYPASVSPDYLRYQIFNALQAFCSSLAGLLSSRALLEGFGVGNADASATHALLLTVLQDFFSRVTTICAAYVVGPSLSCEAKTYRLLADVANDAAIVLDTLTPLLNTCFPGLRIAALCLSGTLRALCGIAAGGSKAALANHFATPISGTGDIGDLNAKDSSKETVLALLGMLAGSLIVPYLTTPFATYSVLFWLVALHLGLNYLGIRGVVLRSLNRQRMSIAWDMYRESGGRKIPTPTQVADIERVFESPGLLRELRTNSIAGRCSIGSSLNQVLRGGLVHWGIFDQMKDEKYVLWLDRRSMHGNQVRTAGRVHLHICFKEGFAAVDQLKAWAHAVEVGRMVVIQRRASFPPPAPAELVLAAYRRAEPVFAEFLKGLDDAGWNTAEPALLPGSPRALILSIEPTELEQEVEEKKKV
ncbi:vitamin B6 photo-protection and homoeostasis-domain-containing protein [Roridomyces roridus]|uniref:Vitamin B6 photo-protection and homoeostasis-domain-containing protein n=1 Tax=Roridomyces roridus TaxID=1738132 RepID=A0AAD7C1P7_9AGAR|nr:vitamin B6 photo-protection and homoeostasis-domain-containing protein [Roridomyces roridus]